jgi:hypothetical protein
VIRWFAAASLWLSSYTVAVRLASLWILPTWFVGGCASEHSLPRNPAESKVTAANPRSRFCAPHAPEVCLDGVDNNCNGLFEEGCGVAQGTVHFFISWKHPEVDVDLVVVDPSGATAELGAVSKGGLLKERECPGKGEASCKNGAYENVVAIASRDPMPGRYLVEITTDPAPSEAIEIVLAGRVGSRVVWEQFSLEPTVTERRFNWSLPGVP